MLAFGPPFSTPVNRRSHLKPNAAAPGAGSRTIRTTDVIERLDGELRRRSKAQSLPTEEAALGRAYNSPHPRVRRAPSERGIILTMTPRERRLQGRARIILQKEDDGSFDREFTGRLTPGERLEAVWELTLEYLAWRGEDASEPRLQRSVCRVEHRGR